MKKALLFTLSVCLVAALLIFSGSSDRGSEATYTSSAPAAADASPSPEVNVIRIGVPASLTGPGSTDDARVLLGLRYANSVAPTVDIGSVSYRLKLVETDDAGTAAGAQAAAASLEKAGVAAVVGPFLAQSARQALPIYEKDTLPVLSVCGAAGQAADSTCFSLASSESLSGGAAASLAQSLGCGSAAVLTDSADSASQALGSAFVAAFTRLGGSCTEISFAAGRKTELQQTVRAVESSGANVVFMASTAEDGQAFLRLARKSGFLSPVIGPASWDAGLLLSDADYYSDNVYVVADYDGCGTEQVSAGFASRFSAWAGDAKNAVLKNGGSNYASSYSALGYDAYMLLVRAVKAAASTDPAAITDALRQTSYSGVTGTISFDKNGAAGRTLAYIKQLDPDKGRFTLLKTIEIGG